MSTNSEHRDAESIAAMLPLAADGPIGREARFLADLQQMAADRADTETLIEARHRAATEAAERSYQQGLKSLEAWLAAEQQAIADQDVGLRQETEERFQTDTQQTERAFAELQQRVTAESQAARQAAQQAWDEARWEAETFFDGHKAVAPRKLDEFERQLDAWRTHIAADRDAARRLLARWKQSAFDTAGAAAPALTAEADLTSQLQERVDFVAAASARLGRLGVPGLAASWPAAWFYVLAVLAAAGVALANGFGPLFVGAGLLLAVVLGIGARIGLQSAARAQIAELLLPLEAAASHAEALLERTRDDARARTAAQQTKLIDRREQSLSAAEAEYRARIQAIDRQCDTALQEPAARYPHRLAEIAAQRERGLAQAEQMRASREAEARRQFDAKRAEIEERYRRQTELTGQRYLAQWQRLVEQWQAGIARMQSLADHIQGQGAPAAERWLADLGTLAAGGWPPASAIPPAIRFGQFQVRLEQVPHGWPQDQRLAPSTPESFSLPALLRFPQQASLLFKARGEGRQVAIEAMQAVMLRLLVTIPPGKLRFTIIDPVGLGENFAAFMHLADFNEALVSSRIWTEPRHIEQRLADLSEHMENVIQKYLRNEFPTIEDYNREAGEIAEPFRFLVIASFPAGFTEAAQRRLLSIAASGARCGVYTLIMVDTQLPLPNGFSLRDLEQHSLTLAWKFGQYGWSDEQFGKFALQLDRPPPPAQATELLQTAGRQAQDAGRVEVPFDVIAPADDQWWTSSARFGIDVPLGRAGATRLQWMKLGQGTSQHVLIAGKTGSGKSTLLHALITNIALRYNPDEIELYLIDFKQGVEFKTYATHALPHARVVAIESDREFGLSVLGRLDAELKLRADRFRELGVQDLAGYRQADSAPLPRILLIVDEFQEFFVEDDKISQDSALLLDRLVRQGRAFGIHVLLGSQTLAGTYTLARSTIGQMAVRVALQCSEADAHLILSEDNSAARLLSRAGEAIYNDSNGLVEGNHPFQVVWLPDERREGFLERVQSLAQRSGRTAREQVVFEGNLPADPRHNPLLSAVLRGGRAATAPAAAQAWLGDAVAIKDPTSVTFRPQSGSNLLIVGQNEEAALGMFASVLIGLAAQLPAAEHGETRFYVLDGSPVGSEQAAALGALPGLTSDGVRVVGPRELPATVNELALELDRRQKSDAARFSPRYVLVYGVQKLRSLRRGEDDFGFSRSSENQPPDPARQFAAILRDGPPLGIYVVAWCDSMNNLNRTWDRQSLREFEMRVALQMSGNDSSTLIDTPLAARLGMFRALFHSEEQGVLDKFRPYRWPAADWLAWVRQRLGGSQPHDAPAPPAAP